MTSRDERFVNEKLFGAYRTGAQIDRDRIIYSPYLARLTDITQVRSVDGFLVHNRLTHSLKVAQLARRLAELVRRKQPSLAEKLGVDPDVAEAAGLAHDMGHPPFGHIAEEELNALVKDQGIEDGYEGNAQSFRILVKLSIGDTQPDDRSMLFLPGLNPTRATLNAVLKYPWFHAKDEARKSRKWGVYRTEAPVFEWARSGTAVDIRSAEAEIMDWADDITYAIHDMVDFHCAGLIPLHLLCPVQVGTKLIPRSEREENTVFESFQRSRPDLASDLEKYRVAFREALKFANTPRPYEGALEDSRDLWAFTSVLIGNYLEAFELVDPEKSGRCAEIKEHARNQTTILKELTRRYVIMHNDLATIQHGQRAAIRGVFKIFLDAITDGRYQMLPRGFADLIKNSPEVPPARWVADYISSLTERDFSRLCQRVTSC